MKTRNGFVSNSSSSSFIVLMGKSFNPTDEEIQEAILDSGYDYDKVTVRYIKDRIELVKKGSHLQDYDNYLAIRVIAELCDRADIILDRLDVGSDRGLLSNALTEKNKELIQKAAKELE